MSMTRHPFVEISLQDYLPDNDVNRLLDTTPGSSFAEKDFEEWTYQTLLPLAKFLVKIYQYQHSVVEEKERPLGDSLVGCMLCPHGPAFKGWNALLIHLQRYWKCRPCQHRALFRAMEAALISNGVNLEEKDESSSYEGSATKSVTKKLCLARDNMYKKPKPVMNLQQQWVRNTVRRNGPCVWSKILSALSMMPVPEKKIPVIRKKEFRRILCPILDGEDRIARIRANWSKAFNQYNISPALPPHIPFVKSSKLQQVQDKFTKDLEELKVLEKENWPEESDVTNKRGMPITNFLLKRRLRKVKEKEAQLRSLREQSMLRQEEERRLYTSFCLSTYVGDISGPYGTEHIQYLLPSERKRQALIAEYQEDARRCKKQAKLARKERKRIVVSYLLPKKHKDFFDSITFPASC